MTTLLVLYRRPDGGPDAQATFERRYAEEHLPLVAGTPGLRETRIQRVTGALTLVDVAFPAAAPAVAARATSLDGVALGTLRRPEALNALSFDLLDDLVTALNGLDRDAACRAIVITGSGTRAFAAGADI